MQIVLVTGFLGAGKTTFLQRLIAAGDQRKTAFIVNEFGAVGVDGAILREGQLDLVELADGCLCCTLRGALADALEQLLANPELERIVIEASGAALPQDTLQLLDGYRQRPGVTVGPTVGVLDAARYQEQDRRLGEFLDRQIVHADVLIMNKTDLASAEQLADVRLRLHALHADASVVLASHCDVDADAVLSSPAAPHDARPAAATTHSALRSFVLRLHADCTTEALRACFAEPPPGLARAKGFARLAGADWLVQYAGHGLEICPSAVPARSEIVLIGVGLQAEALQLRFASVGTLQQPGLRAGPLRLAA